MKFSIFVFVLFLSASVFGFAGPQITSSTHPDGEVWSTNDSPRFEFEFDGASGYSFVFDRFPDTIPDDVSDSTDGEKVFLGKDNGQWFFHVIYRAGGQWSEASHYGLKIDRFPPFAATALKASPLGAGSIQLTWNAGLDSHSGIKGYKIYRGLLTGFSIIDEGATVISELTSGTSYVDEGVSEGVYYHYILQSIDNAGNTGGLSNEAISRSSSSCDLTIVVEGAVNSGSFDLNILSDDFIFDSYLDVTLPQSDTNRVFFGISARNAFYYSFDLNGLPPGKIVIYFSGEDSENDPCVVEQDFFVDYVDPQVDLVSPVDRAFLTDVVTLSAIASDEGVNPSGVSIVEFFYDRNGRTKLGDGVLSGSNYVFDWNTLTAENASYDLIARVTDESGRFSEDKIRVTLKNTALDVAEVNALLSVAQEAKVAAEEVKSVLVSLGVLSSSFDNLFSLGEASLSNSKIALEKGVNFERAKLDAQAAADSFNGSVGAVDVSVYESKSFTYKKSDLERFFAKAGLRKDLVQLSLGNFSLYKPKRTIDFYKVVDGNNSFYRAMVVLTFDSNVSVKIVEVVPKSFAATSTEIISNPSFIVLSSDPVLLFDVQDSNSVSVSYSLNKNFTKKQVDDFVKLKSEDFFPVPSLVFSGSQGISSDIVITPVDLFGQFGPAFFGIDLFSGFLLFAGILLVISFVLAAISFVIIVLIVLKSGRKKGLGH